MMKTKTHEEGRLKLKVNTEQSLTNSKHNSKVAGYQEEVGCGGRRRGYRGTVTKQNGERPANFEARTEDAGPAWKGAVG